MKKPWKKPELVILFKGKPGEAVLCHCKNHTGPGVPGQSSCYDWTPKCKDNEGQS